MRIVISFFLALFIYSAIILIFIYFIFSMNSKQISKTIYVHQAIMIPQKKTQKVVKAPSIKKHIAKQEKPKPIKKTQKVATKDNFSKGGKDIKLDDIFSNIEAKVPTTKIKQKKQKNMTKQNKNENQKLVKQLLNNIQTTTEISNTIGNQGDIEYIQNEFAKIWNSIETNDGDFIRIEVNIINGSLNFSVISTNLDTIRLNQFITKLKSIDTQKVKNLKAVIDFKSKLKD